MKHALWVACLTALLIITAQSAVAQETSIGLLARSTTAVAGSSQTVRAGQRTYVVQQSFGQAGVIGTLRQGGLVLRQGFIQPFTVTASVTDEPRVELLAVVHPNPFTDRVTVSFSRKVSAPVGVSVFDMAGRLVYRKEHRADENLEVELQGLAPANYILRAVMGNKTYTHQIIKTNN